jgi:hypothetical protein
VEGGQFGNINLQQAIFEHKEAWNGSNTYKELYVVRAAHYFICFVSIISAEVLSGL